MYCSVCAADNPDSAPVCRSCGSPLSTPAVTSTDQILPPGTALQAGAFLVDGVLGQGGFGITYRGRDTKLNRMVALKEFFPQAQGCLRRGTTVHPSGGLTVGEFHEERNKFLEEGQRLAQFQHASIVKVFSLFEENNTAYMVMEFLKGKTMLEMVEESGPVEERVLVPLIEQVADAMTVVHQANVIHRDIKPENIVVTSDHRAVLLDFGTAREFAAGKTRRMTTILTPGYAPLEQYGQHARFGVFTDIYALGATTYHLLAGQVPIQATDRAAGVELVAPRRLNNKISRQVSDAVMWAMEMKVDRRPQTASDFVQAMRGARSASTNGSAKGSTATPQIAPNPYQARIDQLLAELESVPSAPPDPVPGSTQQVMQSRYDPEIKRITEQLDRIRTSLKIGLKSCPFCSRAALERVEPTKSYECPVCCGAHLMGKKIDQTLCPVCREGHIAPTPLESQMMFCPVCQSRSLREEKRKRLGLAIDLWWVCPGCSAEFDVVMGGRAKLVSVGTDPLGSGKEYLGETLSIAKWQQLAPRSGECWTCDRCAAQFYELGDSRLALDWVERDPHGVREKLLGKTYYRTVWAKIANGLSAKVGNTLCQGCGANFDYDRVDKKLKLLDCDRARFPRAIPFLGQLHSLGTWSLFAAGKNSLSPGWICSSCEAEFDEPDYETGTGDGHSIPINPLTYAVKAIPELEPKLVGGPPDYHNFVGQSRSFGNWHRLAKKLPSEEQEVGLRAELTRLESEKREEELHLIQAERARSDAMEKQLRRQRAGIEKQIQDLVKQSFVGGFIALGLQTRSIVLKKDERVAWESAVFRLKQRSSNGVPYWGDDGVGALVVTDQRVIFCANTGAMWSKSLTKLLSVYHEFIHNQGICILWIDGQQKPIGFGVVATSGTASIGNNTFALELTSQDLLEVLQVRCGG